MTTEYDDGAFKHMMEKVVYLLESAGYDREAEAMIDLTHIISSRISPPDISHKYGREYLLDCITAQHQLIRYIDIENMEFQKHQ